MKFNWYKWNRVLHRDMGYLIFGMTIIYALSGIALNHLQDWNPSYNVTRTEVHWEANSLTDVTKPDVLTFLERYGEQENYKKHYYPQPGLLKVFLENGSVELDTGTGQGVMEILKRRPLFFEVNYLHYNPKRSWSWFSDLFSVTLIVVAITGLFILKGKRGIKGRGAWLTGLGVLIPLIMLIMYLA